MAQTASTSRVVRPAGPLGELQMEYAHWRDLFARQPAVVQRFVQAQGQLLARALAGRVEQARFELPPEVAVPLDGDELALLELPAGLRAQHAGGLRERLRHADIAAALAERLGELEHDLGPAVACAAGLVRYATTEALVHRLLPAGRPVRYVTAVPDDEIPSVPASDRDEPDSALTDARDAIAEQAPAGAERGELQAAFVPAARRFFLPHWVAFDVAGRLLVGSVAEAEALVTSMERFLALLQLAVALAPYVVADPEYQRKRYGMLGQLVNQGRALARYQNEQLIAVIRERAGRHDLDRGLHLHLPYFDDQQLAMRTRLIEVIPAGRIMFLPAFVVRAACSEQARVAQDVQLSRSTRRHLLVELKHLELAFAGGPPAAPQPRA
jgi:hypothetical protein